MSNRHLDTYATSFYKVFFMATIIHISDEPTHDIQNFSLLHVEEEDRMCYFQTNDIYKFDKVYGNLAIRSRVLRWHETESRYVEDIISAIIDAGYCGKLSWKTKLTHH